MKQIKLLSTLFLALTFSATFAQDHKYETVPNDPIGVRIYTLSNGLKVYLSENKDQPRVQTFIAVKTGSKNDPADVTGLAHYLEHMVFKGTSKFATLDWEKEKPLLDQISDLYEQHKAEPDEAKKKEIYHLIDSVSGEAAKYAIANEYDKMISGLGAKGTNAFTSVERTAYINDIPATELEKWMMVESERFGELVLRLFHTELEAVYEEFNRTQDNDYRKVSKQMNEMLFPTHPYGTQTTIGEGDHLKNPSMVKIHEYFDQYYVANNMAICISGDIDFDKTIAMVDKYFGKLKAHEVNPRVMPEEKPLATVQTAEVFGPMGEWISIGYRFGGYHTKDAIMTDLISSILYNGQAGLIDLDLMQQQKVLRANAYSNIMHDYSTFQMMGNPKGGQTLEDVQGLLLAEVEKIKKGEFSEDLMRAVIKNLKKDQLSQFEANWLRGYIMADAYIMEANWSDYVTYFDRMAKITKEELVAWANESFKDNYCVVYKRTGEDKNVYKVDKPEITPVEINREAKSKFYQDFEKMESLRLKPEFIDYKTALKQKELAAGVPFYYVKNTTNDLFTLFVEMDEDLKTDKKVAMALSYLPYLGTDKYTAAELKQKFFALGVDYDAKVSADEVYLYMSGLNESFDEALKLLEEVIHNCKADEEALKNLVADMKKQREDAKKNKGAILYSGLRNYAKYGKTNPFNDQLPNEQLDKITSSELIDIIHNLTNYKHSVFYYGKSEMDNAYNNIKASHSLPAQLTMVENPVKYPELPTKENLVYFVDYDMVQTELIMLSKGDLFNASIMPQINLFNTYFGAGLSSIVFQEIREAKALAYSANSYITVPNKKDESHYVQAYIGTQVNKLPQAVDAMGELMNNMPKAEIQFNESKVATLKKIESDRIIKTNIYWSYQTAQKRGLDYDIRKDVYEKVGTMTIDDMEKFFNENIKGKDYVYCVIGKKADMDMEALKKLGTIKELTLEEVFGY